MYVFFILFFICDNCGSYRMQHLLNVVMNNLLAFMKSYKWLFIKFVMSCDVFVNNCLSEKKVTEEVKSITGPSKSSLYYCAATNSMRKIHRKPKRKESVTRAKKKGKMSSATFQKKLVVLKYMGRDPPSSFTKSDKRIIVRGLLPSISVEATEEQIREEIC